ncbi:hypothetical protein DL93DRAFT_2230948 [Clavulina sp. PMI_390]|nr:hypothetical protein DL93DRAFT_2230948 [Clavulina sp. PMI_390]
MSTNAQIPGQFIKLRELNLQLTVVALPPELLGRIFLECIDRRAAGPFNHLFSVVETRNTRTSIASVCYRWRQVALATRPLWAVTSFPRLIASLGSESNKRADPYNIPPETYESFHHELELSGEAPLSLLARIVVYKLATPSVISALEHELCTALSPVIPRCDTISLEALGSLPFDILENTLNSQALVKSLDFSSWGWGSHGEGRYLDLSHAGFLEHLSIDLSARSSCYEMPVGKPIVADPTILQTLKICGYVDPVAAYEIISRAVSLRSLVWESSTAFTEFTVSPQEVSMPLLRHLSLNDVQSLSLLPYLDAPRLVSVTLELKVEYPDEPIEPLPFPKSLPHLRFLDLHSAEYASFAILPGLLSEFRALEILGLRGVMSEELVAACTAAIKLRLVGVTWAPNEPNGLLGAQTLLQCWSRRAQSGEVPLLSRGVYFVYGDPGRRKKPPTPADESTFGDEIVAISQGVKPGLCWESPFRWWQLEDWDNLVAKIDADPSYLPAF